MHAYQVTSYDGLSSIHAVDLPKPVPGPGQILVAIKAASLNFRDLMVANGQYPLDKSRPIIPLSDGVGEVIEVGAGVCGFKPGDRVMGTFFHNWEDGDLTQDQLPLSRGGGIDGVLAEFVVFNEHELVQIPAHLTYAEAATLPCAAVTAWQALVVNGKLKAGETVVTLGTGGVSLFALQFAKMHGARVIITSSSDEKLARAKALGADHTINYKTHPDWDQKVLELTDGRGADHVIELGGQGTLEKSLSATRHSGHVAMIGVLAHGSGGEGAALQILFRQIKLLGVLVASRQTLIAMNKAIALNGLKPVIDRVFRFDQALDAYHHLQSGSHFGKIVIA